MCDYHCNATYLAESDQVVTMTTMETDESSMLSSLLASMTTFASSSPQCQSAARMGEGDTDHQSQVARAPSIRTPC